MQQLYSLYILIQAIREVYAEERRERVAKWKAWVDASVDLPDKNDLDAMLPESAGSTRLNLLILYK